MRTADICIYKLFGPKRQITRECAKKKKKNKKESYGVKNIKCMSTYTHYNVYLSIRLYSHL